MEQALLFGLLSSVGAMVGAALLLVFPEVLRQRLLPCLLSYATGTLWGAAFLGMLLLTSLVFASLSGDSLQMLFGRHAHLDVLIGTVMGSVAAGHPLAAE